MINAGHVLLLAGPERLLAGLPPGCWIGGTAAKFITPEGGAEAADSLYFADFTAVALAAQWRVFDAGNIHELAQGYPGNGFAILLVPGFSPLLSQVAGSIMDYEGLYNLPLMGWVSAVALEELPEATPKIFAGGPAPEANRAAALYVTLPDTLFAQLHIANLFMPGGGPEIRFLAPGQVTDGACLIGGARDNLARYIEAKGIDRRLPLVADHDGALVNVAILEADAQSGAVAFLSPVGPGLSYRFAEAVPDYEMAFAKAVAALAFDYAAHACVCIMQYHHAGLAAPRGLAFTAPVTFGQIAYTVLNQTLICLAIGRHEEGLEEPAFDDIDL